MKDRAPLLDDLKQDKKPDGLDDPEGRRRIGTWKSS